MGAYRAAAVAILMGLTIGCGESKPKTVEVVEEERESYTTCVKDVEVPLSGRTGRVSFTVCIQGTRATVERFEPNRTEARREIERIARSFSRRRVEDHDGRKAFSARLRRVMMTAVEPLKPEKSFLTRVNVTDY